MTFFIEPGKRECFYEHAQLGQMIDIEYQVIDGGHGDMDISFELSHAGEHMPIVISDYKRSENMHRIDVDQDADYRFCFDNTHSTFNRKTVFFELILEGGAGVEKQESNEFVEYEGLSPEEVYEVTVEQIHEAVFKVKELLAVAKSHQDYLRNFEARDRNIAEQNFSKVNSWSLFQICLMIAVGALQVFMVRSLFDAENKAHKFWGKLSETLKTRF